MMSDKKISVLLPNYNNGPYLKQALDSVFNKSHQNFVIYFVDDCSIDDSVDIAKSYNDDRLIIIEKNQNSGIVDTMNRALAFIETEYFIRMDGDDISTPDRFEVLINFMDEHQDIGVCSSDIRTFGKENVVLHFERDPMINKANLIFGHSIGHASSIFRTAVFKENSIVYQDTYWRLEDYDLFYRLKDITRTTSIPGELYHYRRELYNDNPEIAVKKNEEFRKFYTEILAELGVETSAKHLDMHLQLNNRAIPTFKLKDYKNYCSLLLNANSKSKIFPQVELEKVLDKYLSKFIYRLISYNQMGPFEVLSLTRIKPSIVYYYFRAKVHQILGRNK